ncbi:MAG: dienelactone hydrolase family protein [Paracoccaceae bacterium]
MTGMIQLEAADGHRLDAYRAGPAGEAAAGLVVIQEIFGVNAHIRSVTERFAAQGFDAIAPALFDRVGRGIELGYEADDIADGRAIRAKVATDEALADVAAAVAALGADGRKVGVVGYCWGGSLAWAAATRLDGVGAAVSYYGGQVAEWADEQPRCPVMLHFGETDASIPMEQVQTVRAKHPDLPLHVYPAGHGFSCDARASYHAPSAALALERTLSFLRKNLGR